MSNPSLTAAQLLARTLERHGVKFVFGIPGAKIDAVFDALEDSDIRLIVCRHEQNAAFMAAALGRITGQPGVVLVTSGPGVANLATGLMTATTEGDPVVALGGAVPRNMALKATHQSADNCKILEAVTKRCFPLMHANNVAEALANAFRVASAPRRGAVFMNLPSDILREQVEDVITAPAPRVRYGPATTELLQAAATALSSARLPVVLLGEEASQPDHAKTLAQFLETTGLPAVCTYQGAGVVSRSAFSRFVGRVGLFKNMPGDRLLDAADVVLAVGYNPVEYDPEIWNARRHLQIFHLDESPCSISSCYQPHLEILGPIAKNTELLTPLVKWHAAEQERALISELHKELFPGLTWNTGTSGRIHPLAFIEAFRGLLRDDDFVTCDIGTVYMWMARALPVFRPRQLLFSNGQQTLGVALPWAIACKLAFPERRVFSVSGDGGFLFSAMELETAVREKTPFIHFVWTDGSYNMVLEQELLKYARPSGAFFGHVDIPKFAEAFGARGYVLDRAEDLPELVRAANESAVPVLVDVPVDYSENRPLFVQVDENRGN